MKKMLLILALGLTFQVASAQVSSRNAAGYVKKTVDRGKLMFLANPFFTFDGSDHTLTTMLGTDNLPGGSNVFTWDQGSQVWEASLFREAQPPFNPTASWSPDRSVQHAEGFFVQIPDNAAAASYDIYLFGEVPDSITAPTHQLAIADGLTSFGFAYPVARVIENTDFNSSAQGGDNIFFWNQDTGWGAALYREAQPPFNPTASWSPSVTLSPGCGYFYQSSGANSIMDTKPYSWP